MSAEDNETPMGMITVAILMAILGLFSLLYGLALAGLGGIASSIGSAAGSGQMQAAGGLLQIFGVIQLVGAIGKFVGIFGVIKAKSWGFYLVEVIFAAEVLQNLYGFVGGSSSIGAISLLILIANAGILIYVFTMQDYFGVSLGGSSRGVPS